MSGSMAVGMRSRITWRLPSIYRTANRSAQMPHGMSALLRTCSFHRVRLLLRPRCAVSVLMARQPSVRCKRSAARWAGGTHGRCPPPRTTACGTTPHLASPRWGEVPSHRTRWEAGDQVWRRVENLSQKSPKYLDTYFAPLPPGVGEGWDGGA